MWMVLRGQFGLSEILDFKDFLENGHMYPLLPEVTWYPGTRLRSIQTFHIPSKQLQLGYNIVFRQYKRARSTT